MSIQELRENLGGMLLYLGCSWFIMGTIIGWGAFFVRACISCSIFDLLICGVVFYALVKITIYFRRNFTI